MAQEQTPYYQASRYPTRSAAGKAYTSLQQIIHEVECDLSAYRLFVPGERKWYVVVIGEQPDQQLHERLKLCSRHKAAVNLPALMQRQWRCSAHDACSRHRKATGLRDTIPCPEMMMSDRSVSSYIVFHCFAEHFFLSKEKYHRWQLLTSVALLAVLAKTRR
jgi:hypothetical protein